MKTAEKMAAEFFVKHSSEPTSLALENLLRAYGEQVKQKCLEMAEEHSCFSDEATERIRRLELP